MLRNRSRVVSSKQAIIMADQSSIIPSPTKNPSSSPISSLLGSPRFLNGLLTKPFSDSEMSPTSILDTKNSTSFVDSFGNDKNFLPKPQNLSSPETYKSEPEGIALALIDSLNEEKSDGNLNFSKPINRTALFASKLKVQIPAINSLSGAESPKSPADFGIKTRNSHPVPETPEKSFSRQLSLKEMELSEDYTCVITHGPNPKTTHIFDNCIVESCCGEDVNLKTKSGFETNVSASASLDFLSFCHTCADSLGQGKDIKLLQNSFPVRGERAMNADAGRCFYEGMKKIQPFGLVHYTDSPCFTFFLQRNLASRKEIFT
ncbi:UNVERIFIED_CONTAM: FCS-Like Zinc finger 8 [Sesamum radiatum]|uniref:FCS-Like Zinc finger 8 n=1 Tax=Sesamum radiatum TaxID=300843 RepID=A0AAW2WB45_SESRA